MSSLSQRIFSLIPRSSIERVKGIYGSLLENYYRGLIKALPNGLNSAPRPKSVIVSLTSIPGRLFSRADITITTLLKQNFKPDRVILWLSDEIKAKDLPANFGYLIEAGLEIQYRKDVGPHTKCIYAMQEYPESIVVAADDDLFYAPDWLGELYTSYTSAPTYIHCQRAHLMRKKTDGTLLPYQEWIHTAPGTIGPSHLLFPTSGAGMLVPPGALPSETHNIEAFRRLCPTNDDIWYKAMALLGDVQCQKVKPYHRENITVKGSQASALININATKNDPQIHATFEAYDLYRHL